MNPSRNVDQGRTPRTRLAWLLAAAMVVSLLVNAPIVAAEYAVDTVHSSALFKIKHLDTAYFYGAFRDISGTIEYDAANPAASSVRFEIDANSVDSRNSNRDDHIKSPDFLNAKQFPKITFESTKVSGTADELQVTGNLTVLGVTEEITLDVTKTGEGTNPRSQKEMVGFHTEFTVDRTAHDMNFMVGPLSKDIKLIVSVEAIKQ